MKVLYYILIGIVSMFFILSCSPTKHLKKDEYILYKNSVKNAPKNESSNLTNLYKQKSNRKFARSLIYVRFYNFGKIFYDTANVIKRKERLVKRFDTKIDSAKNQNKKNLLIAKKEKKVKRKDLILSDGNSFMRSFGEPPEIFDSLKLSNTAESMHIYLFSKGYFQNKITTQLDTTYRKKRIFARYIIEAGTPHMIDSIRYTIDDKKIDSLINNPDLYSKTIKKNEKYDEDKFNTERENIYKLLKDQGYFNFQRSNILFEVDSLKAPYKVNITIIVKDSHYVYQVSEMYFNINDAPTKKYTVRDTILYKNLHYVFYKKTFLRKLLDYKIAIRPYDKYSQSKFQRTQQLLGAMDMYKFVNINIIENKHDTLNKTLTAYINTQPMDKYQISQEYGLSVGQALIPGPFLSFTLKTRNLFHWLESIENTFRYSFEAQYTNAATSETYRAREFSANSSINLSQLIFQTRLRDIMKAYNPKVKFSTGYTYIKRPEYRRESFKSGLTYQYSKNTYSSFFITPIEISYIDSKVDSAYNTFLNELKTNSGSNLYLSFNPSIVTNFQLSYVFNNHDFNATKITKYYRPSFEIGGIVPSIISKQFGSADDKENSKLFNKQIYEYIRTALDVRYYFPIKKTSSFVIRFNAGYAQPFGISNKENSYVLPYEKYFFSGGNSSIRAWKPRRLGPGSYVGNSDNDFLYEQPGEVLIETNYELRFKMISIFNGAFFVDAGNVWTLKNEKEGTQFKLPTAINQVAVGAGFGLRLDFSFLIFRLDIANKVVDPAQPEGERFVGKLSLKKSVYNIGIGYPF